MLIVFIKQTLSHLFFIKYKPGAFLKHQNTHISLQHKLLKLRAACEKDSSKQ